MKLHEDVHCYEVIDADGCKHYFRFEPEFGDQQIAFDEAQAAEAGMIYSQEE